MVSLRIHCFARLLHIWCYFRFLSFIDVSEPCNSFKWNGLRHPVQSSWEVPGGFLLNQKFKARFRIFVCKTGIYILDGNWYPPPPRKLIFSLKKIVTYQHRLRRQSSAGFSLEKKDKKLLPKYRIVFLTFFCWKWKGPDKLQRIRITKKTCTRIQIHNAGFYMNDTNQNLS
jgi:hypothetical protein